MQGTSLVQGLEFRSLKPKCRSVGENGEVDQSPFCLSLSSQQNSSKLQTRIGQILILVRVETFFSR